MQYGNACTDYITEVNAATGQLTAHRPPKRYADFIQNEYKYDNTGFLLRIGIFKIAVIVHYICTCCHEGLTRDEHFSGVSPVTKAWSRGRGIHNSKLCVGRFVILASFRHWLACC